MHTKSTLGFLHTNCVPRKVHGPGCACGRHQRACHHIVQVTNDGGVDETTDAVTYGNSTEDYIEARSGWGYLYKWDKGSVGNVGKSFRLYWKETPWKCSNCLVTLA